MSLTLPKINIGKVDRKRQVFDKSHSVATTSGFGHVQPLCVLPCTPGSVNKLGTHHEVRMAAMPLPTRGSLALHTYHRFVPIEDLFEPFANLLSGTAYSTPAVTYVPEEVPNIYQNDLILMFLGLSESVSFYQQTNQTLNIELVTGNDWNNQCFGVFNEAFSYMFADPNHNPYWLTRNSASNVGVRVADPENPVTLEGADFVLKHVSGTVVRYAAFNYGYLQKNVRKILLGCGYQINLRTNRPLSILPLIAYYKAYYDQFAPKRNSTWTDTNIYKYLQYLIYNGVSQQFTNNSQYELFRAFMIDLRGCYYTANPDYFTAQTALPVNPVTTPDIKFMQTTDNNIELLPRTDDTTLPFINDISLTRVGLQMLNRATKIIRKDSVVGKKVEELLFKYGMKPIHNMDSNYIGSTITPCQIGNVMNTAQTTEGHLGEFAGVGIGEDNDTKIFEFTAKTYGYWITLACIVPEAGYTQCNNSNGAVFHVSKYQFYTSEFDAIGDQVTSMDEFIGQSDYAQSSNTKQDPTFFGRISRYAEYKVKSDLINGDISARSTRASLLAFTLNRFYAPDDLTPVPLYNSEGAKTNNYTRVYEKIRPNQTVTTEMRYIGKDENAGNFNRIFYNSANPFDSTANMNPTDNFIITTNVSYKFIAPMVSLADSYDTDSESDVTMSVEHE